MTDYADLSAFLALPRLTALALSPDGARLVAAVQRPDAKAARQFGYHSFARGIGGRIGQGKELSHRGNGTLYRKVKRVASGAELLETV